MPFESKSQMRGAFGGYFGSTMKKKAKQWAKETPNIKKLPERVVTTAIKERVKKHKTKK